MKIKNIKLTCCITAVLGAAVAVPAQTLLYGWDFNNPTGSGATLSYAPSATGLGDVDGNLGLIAGSTTDYSSGPGVSGNLGDFGLVNSGTYGGNVGAGTSALFVGGLTGLGAMNSFSMTMWFDPTGLNSTARLIDVDAANTNTDGSPIYFSFANNTDLQLKVNGTSYGGNATAASGITAGSWYYIAVSYDSTAGVNMYVGSTSTAASLIYSSAVTAGAVAFDTSTNFISVLNALEYGGVRNSDGTIDDLNLYGSALTLAQADTIQASATPEPGAPAMIGLGAGSLLLLLRRRNAF